MNFSQPDWRCQWFHAAIGTGVQREPSPPHPPTLGTTKILGRSWCTGSQGQRGFQLHEGKQKPSLCQPPGREGQPCCPLHHGISCQGKHTTVQLWGKQHFHSERKRMGAKSAPVAWVGPRSCQGQQVPRQRCRGTGPCSPSSQRTLTPFLWSLKFWGWRHSAQA